jgi:hypothetical protein
MLIKFQKNMEINMYICRCFFFVNPEWLRNLMDCFVMADVQSVFQQNVPLLGVEQINNRPGDNNYNNIVTNAGANIFIMKQ